MSRYYTRVCNFYFGNKSKALVKEKKTLPLNGTNQISFDQIEIVSRKSKKKVSLNKVDSLPNNIKRKIKFDLNLITKKKRFKNLKFSHIPKIMGVLNITPDSFSDGGMYLKKKLAYKQLNHLFDTGADIVDIGGESTRPGSKAIKVQTEWKRVKRVLQNIDKKKLYLLIQENQRLWKKELV